MAAKEALEKQISKKVKVLSVGNTNYLWTEIGVGGLKMKNKEKYAKEIVDAVTSGGYGFGFNKFSGEIKRCNEVSCNECLFCMSHGLNDCRNAKREWAESEYIEPVKISKRDREFLDYIKDNFKYIARDESGRLYAYSDKPIKKSCYYDISCGVAGRIGSVFDIKLPMVKWEDADPWLIEDLKKLEVCEEYEID